MSGQNPTHLWPEAIPDVSDSEASDDDAPAHNISRILFPKDPPFYDDSLPAIVLPRHLSSKSWRWASLLLVTVTGAFASGPLLSWPTLEPLLIGEGVWAGPHQQVNLTNVFSIAMGVAMVSGFFYGALYDAIGPRTLGVGGAFGAAIALFAMALAIQMPFLNNMLWIAYPAAVAFGSANSMDAYAWLWLLPDDQATVAALVGAIQCLADSFCLFAAFLHDYYGLHLPVYFIITTFLALLAGVIAFLVIPSQRDLHRIAHSGICHRNPDESSDEYDPGYGATDHARPFYSSEGSGSSIYGGSFSRQVSQRSFASGRIRRGASTGTLSGPLSKSWSAIKDTFIVYTKIHPAIFGLFCFYNMAQTMSTVYPTLQLYPLYKDLMGSVNATFLVDTFGAIYACVGAAALLMFGKVVDHLGMAWSIAGLNLAIMVNAYLYSVARIPAQVAAQVLLAFMSNVWFVLIPCFCISYGPPELFGTMNGAFPLIFGFGQMILSRFGTWASKVITQYLGVGQPAFPILLTIDTWCFFTVLGSVFLLRRWWYYPFPLPGGTTMADVRDAASGVFKRSLRRLSGSSRGSSRPLV